jgi:hypothetical protein
MRSLIYRLLKLNAGNLCFINIQTANSRLDVAQETEVTNSEACHILSLWQFCELLPRTIRAWLSATEPVSLNFNNVSNRSVRNDISFSMLQSAVIPLCGQPSRSHKGTISNPEDVIFLYPKTKSWRDTRTSIEYNQLFKTVASLGKIVQQKPKFQYHQCKSVPENMIQYHNISILTIYLFEIHINVVLPSDVNIRLMF